MPCLNSRVEKQENVVQVSSKLTKLAKSIINYLMSISKNYIIFMVDTSKTNHKTYSFTSMINNLPIIIFYVYIYLLIFRLFFCAFVLNLNTFTYYFNTYDHLLHFFVQTGLVDRYLALALCPSPLLLLYMDYIVHFTHGYPSYNLVYDIIILNRKHFWVLNPQITNWRIFLKSLWQYDNKRCARVKLPYSGPRGLPTIGHLEHAIRCRAVVIAAFGDICLAITLLSIICFFSGLFYFYQVLVIWPLYGKSSPSTAVVLAFDIFLLLYIFFHCLKLAFFFALVVILLIYVFGAQQNVDNERLKVLLIKICPFDKQMALPQMINQTKSSFKQQQQFKVFCQGQHQLAAYLAGNYLFRHFLFVKNVIEVDEDVISRYLFFAFISIFGFHVYSLSALTLKSNLSHSEQFLLFSYVSIVGFLFLIDILPFLMLNLKLHSPAKLLYPSVWYLSNGNYLHLKIKSAVYYEVLTSGEKFGFSMGPVGKLTPSSLFDVSLNLFFKNKFVTFFNISGYLFLCYKSFLCFQVNYRQCLKILTYDLIDLC